jgi:cytosine/adenosine deaminase-related metal-dependent hydrolase
MVLGSQTLPIHALFHIRTHRILLSDLMFRMRDLSFVINATITVFLLCACGGGSTASDTTNFLDESPVDQSITDNGSSSTDQGNPMPTPTLNTCETFPQEMPAELGCVVIEGVGSHTLITGTVLRPGEALRHGGLVYDSNGVIQCVGCACAEAYPDATRITCNKVAVSPGLINTHDHMGWMGDRPWVATENQVDPELRWEHRHDWRKGKRGNPKISTQGGANANEKIWGELRFVLSGATSINGSGASDGLLRNVDKSSGLEGLSHSYVNYQTFPLGDSNGAYKTQGCDYPNILDATFVDSYTPHVSEGIDLEARNEFLCLTSKANGGKEQLKANTSIIHGIGLLPIDVQKMATTGIKLIWSPRSNVSLYGDTAQVTMFHRMGIEIALGTDWLPSGSMNMLREIQCADLMNRNHYGGYFSPEAIWRMATYGAAKAVAFDDVVGILSPGYIADIALFADPNDADFGSILTATTSDVVLVMRGGEILYGDADIVEVLEDGCDSFDVCGVEKRVCLQREVGQSFGNLKSAVSNAYPLYFCETPEDEPTCAPSRTLSQDSIGGSSLYPDLSLDDSDGDGLGDAIDNCIDTFNPVRPVDNGKQGDADGDGVGDVCDPCPLHVDDNCETLNPDDSDGDGILNFDDNCPNDHNPDQSDLDQDDRGDACDACPETPNAPGMGCPISIYNIQDPSSPKRPSEGSSVSVECVVTVDSAFATAKGFWCQDRIGGPYSGIFVYTGTTAPQVDVNGSQRPIRLGDNIQVNAQYVEYYDLSELQNATVVFISEGDPLEAVSVSPHDIATNGAQSEAFEGVLVSVQAVSVITQNADPGKDYDEFEVTGGLRIDDLLIDGTGTGGLLDNTFEVGAYFPDITGVMHYNYSNFKLLPRSIDDIYLGPPDPQAFVPDHVYQRTGSKEATLPSVLTLTFKGVIKEAVSVDLKNLDPKYVSIPESVLVTAGNSSVEIPVHGLAPTTLPARILATFKEITLEAAITVIDPNHEARISSLSPSHVTMPLNGSTNFVVGLDAPAPLEGTRVRVHMGGGSSNLPFGFTSPLELQIPYNQMEGTFEFQSAGLIGSGIIAVEDLNGSLLASTVSVLEMSTEPVDISGWSVTQANKETSFVFPEGTVLSPGDYVIISRNSDKGPFETAWLGEGGALGEQVHFFNSDNQFMVLNGSTTTFDLKNAEGAFVDGPTFDVDDARAYQRLMPVGPADDEASWIMVTGATPGPDSDSNPGSGQEILSPPSGVYISEISDAKGSGNYPFEYIEIYYDGPKPVEEPSTEE